MKEVVDASTTHVKFWDDMADGKQGDFSEVLFGTKLRCTSDQPAANYWKEILSSFPGAKVLTIHPKGAEGWWNSCMKTIFNFQPDFPGRSWMNGGIAVSLMWIACSWLGKMVVKNGRCLDHDYSKEHCMKAYEAWIEKVKSECPEDKPELKATDGWEPLCKFRKPVPDVPYPNVNDSEEFQWLSV